MTASRFFAPCCSLIALAIRDELRQRLIGEAIFALIIDLELIERHELPLARRMIHQRDETDERIVGEFREQLLQTGIG